MLRAGAGRPLGANWGCAAPAAPGSPSPCRHREPGPAAPHSLPAPTPELSFTPALKQTRQQAAREGSGHGWERRGDGNGASGPRRSLPSSLLQARPLAGNPEPAPASSGNQTLTVLPNAPQSPRPAPAPPKPPAPLSSGSSSPSTPCHPCSHPLGWRPPPGRPKEPGTLRLVPGSELRRWQTPLEQ